jgi:hypothetical protein
LDITPEVILKITAHPSLYTEAPFLNPMRDSALNVHRKMAGKCTRCQRKAYLEAGKAMMRAFARLVEAEYAKAANGLPKMKEAIGKLLNSQFSEIRLVYIPAGSNRTAELKF